MCTACLPLIFRYGVCKLIKNYIFDFGNVLARFYPNEVFLRTYPDRKAAEQILSVVFDRKYWDRLDDGTISEEDVISGIRERLHGEMGDVACRLYERWIIDREPVAGMPELVRDIHAAGGKLYLCSNISIRFAEEYGTNAWIGPLFSLFDGLVFSGPLHMTKPGSEIFAHLLQTYELDPAECIFIDDSEKNIIGAKAVNIPGYLFDGDVEKLRKFIGL